MMRRFRDTALWAIAFLLPWQSRYIFGTVDLPAGATQFGILSFFAVEFLVLGALAVLIVTRNFSIDAQYHRPLWLTLGILATAIISATFASDRLVVWNTVLHIAAAMSLFLLILQKDLRLKPLLLAFVLGLIAPSLLGIFQIVMGYSGASTLFGLAARDASALGDVVWVGQDGVRVLRAYGSFSHPNVFAGYLAVGLLGVATLWRRGLSRTKLVGLSITTAILLVAFIGAASRAATLGLLLGLGLMLFVRHAQNVSQARKLVIPLAGVVIACAVGLSFFAPQFVANLRGGGATEEHSLNERQQQYVDFPQVVDLPHAFLGYGPGTYVFALANHLPGRMVWDYQPVHNVFLLIFAELGILGVMVIGLWASSLDKINFARFPNRDALIAFAMGNVLLVVLFFDHYPWSSWSGLALVALVMGLTARMGEEKTP